MKFTSLKAYWIGFIALAFSGIAASNAAETTEPNIVYIIADDLGWKDVGFHGSDITTPNIDNLAQTGARLEQFYAQPMCTPTRAALMTGRYPFRYGLQTAVIPCGAMARAAASKAIISCGVYICGASRPGIGPKICSSGTSYAVQTAAGNERRGAAA